MTDSQDIEDQVKELVDSVELLGKRLLGRKCIEDHVRDEDGDILVAMTDAHINHTLWFEILKVGDACRTITNEHLVKHRLFMYFPEWDDGLHSLGNNLFIVDESMMEGRDPSVKPFVIEEPK